MLRFAKLNMDSTATRINEVVNKAPATNESESVATSLANDTYRQWKEEFGWEIKAISDPAAQAMIFQHKVKEPFAPFKQTPRDIRKKHGDPNNSQSSNEEHPAEPSAEDMQPI